MAIDVYKEWLGIPESVPRPPDHYQLLRLKQFEDDAEKIQAHYKKLNAHVRKYATGQYSIESQHLLNELAKAMLCLTDVERKRDYDESQGREFEAATDALGRQPLLDTLVAEGHISRSQKREVEEFANARGLSERDAVVQMKLVEPHLAAQALARQLGYSYVDLEEVLPEDATLDLVPRSLVKKYTFIPLFEDDGRVLAAVIDELEPELEEEIRLRYGVPVQAVIATPRAINQAIAKYYAPGMRDEAVVRETPKAEASGKKKKKEKTSGGKPAAQSARTSNKSFEDLPESEQQRRRQMGILIMCASIFIPMLLKVAQMFVPKLQLFTIENAWFGWVPWIITLITGSTAALFVTQKYWK